MSATTLRSWYAGTWFAARMPRVFIRLAAMVCAGGAFLSASTPAHALTPESPEVKQLAAKGIKYLEGANYGNWDRHPGCKSLVGMCILKQYGKQGVGHPKVADAVASIRAALETNSIPQTEQIYNIGICLIFLLDLTLIEGDSQNASSIEVAGDHRAEMEGLLKLLLAAQKPHGGFGYPGRETGDTSMTQYGALGMWACQMAGIEVPLDNWERLTNWLLRTQDPSGAYGYQGSDPGGFNLVSQTEIRPSLVAAGLGSVCICADSLRLLKPEEPSTSASALLKKLPKQGEARTKNVDPQHVTDALRRGQGWFTTHYTPTYKVDPQQWIPYYMYAFERYKSFSFLVSGAAKEDTKWYDDGFRFLAGAQKEDGSWSFLSTDGHNYDIANTAFAVLFLYRSTQKIIQHAKAFGGGLLVGGRGLPENASDLELVQGSLRAKALKGPAMELLQKLADPNDPKFEETVRGIEEQSLVEEGDRMTEIQLQLRKMAQGKSPEARAAALKLLGRTRNLDNVPLLIESLHDNDPLIFLAATDALRFISRKFAPAGQFGGADADAQKAAIHYWKAWYRDIRPDAQFDDE